MTEVLYWTRVPSEPSFSLGSCGRYFVLQGPGPPSSRATPPDRTGPSTPAVILLDVRKGTRRGGGRTPSRVQGKLS